MVQRKPTIPPLVYRGTFTGLGAIASGSVYSGQLVKIVGLGTATGGDFRPSTNYVVPIVEPIRASDVAASGTRAVASDGSIQHKPIGVALADAPLQSQYLQLQFGKPLQQPTDVTMYASSTHTDVRRFSIITPKDSVQVWLPYSGGVPTGGEFLTLSSGVDGAVSISTAPDKDFIVGQVMGYTQHTSFSGVTVPNVDAYVLTYLDFHYGMAYSGAV